ncbi:MAG: hypothetical protein J6U55_00900, partial [Bacteroidaceae bacterium]|nr:hypothetical protein [Bacteroidaceae bacterium]
TRDIKLTAVNNHSADSSTILKSRSEVSIEGVILNSEGSKDSDFNGEVYITLYDAEKTTTSHGYDDSIPVEFKERNNKLFSGRAMVRNGSFSHTFRMPKETSFSNKHGLFSLYAHSEQGVEASGSNDNIIIGGAADDAATDTIGPDITYCYLNSTQFSDGDIVNESPVLFAAFNDPSGINLSTAGIGHNMSITVDKQISFNDIDNYYTPDTTGYSGSIYYPIGELEEGEHELTLRVWDNEGNSSSVSLTFIVQKGLAPEIIKIYADQNPARTSTNFYLEHDRPNGVITVNINVYNIQGMPVWSTQKTGTSDLFKSFPINWNLTSNSGARIPGGVYIYQATISTDNTHYTTKSQKLLVTPAR